MEIEEKVTIEREVTVPGSGLKMPAWREMEWDLIIAVIALVVLLLPQILTKLYAFSTKAQANLTANSLIFSQSFGALTLLVGFVLALYALAFSGRSYSVKTIALIALIVAVLKFILPI